MINHSYLAVDFFFCLLVLSSGIRMTTGGISSPLVVWLVIILIWSGRLPGVAHRRLTHFLNPLNAPGPEPEGTKLEHTGTTQLSAFREELKAAAAGNKILFAGGLYSLTNPTVVDIYAATNTWEILQLSEARMECAAGAAGNQLLIGGGTLESSWTKTVDILSLK